MEKLPDEYYHDVFREITGQETVFSKEFYNFKAKFFLNDLQGLMNKYKIGWDRLSSIIPQDELNLDLIHVLEKRRTRNELRQSIEFAFKAYAETAP